MGLAALLLLLVEMFVWGFVIFPIETEEGSYVLMGLIGKHSYFSERMYILTKLASVFCGGLVAL